MAPSVDTVAEKVNVFPTVVGYTKDGLTVWAEVEPSGSRWLPMPGRTARWWFEVHHRHEPDEHGCDVTTHAYTEYGSGGAFTLRRCLMRAARAIDAAVASLDADGERPPWE